MKNSWIPDEETFKQLQKLQNFIDFVSKLEFATEADLNNLHQIKKFIKDLGKKGSQKQWCVCLEIFDPEFRYFSDKTGVYWKNWSIFFEDNFLTVEGSSRYFGEDRLNISDLFYSACFNLNEKIKSQRIYLEKPLDEFIESAKNFKSSITENLNDVELDIDIW